MELREYVNIVKKYKKTVLLCIAAGIGAAFLFALTGYRGYEASLSLAIRPASLDQTTQFQYGGFYVLEASDRVTRMLEQWFKRGGLPIILRRLGNQYLEITFARKEEAQLEPLKETVTQRIQTFLASLSKFPQQSFEAVIIDFSSHKQVAPFGMLLAIGFIGGLIAGLFAALFRHYLSQ